MTHPGQEGQWPQRHGGRPYGNPQPGAYQPAGGQYAAGQEPYQSQGYYYQQQPAAGFPAPPSSSPPKGRRGVIIGLVVALVALLGGGTTWWALTQSHSVAAGADTPTQAAQNLAASIGNGDVVGLLSALAPAEAALFTDPVEATAAELKRLQVLRADADPKSPIGVQLKSENLVFDETQAQRINDHLTITKLTGGTLTLTADMGKLPLAKDFLDAAMPKSEQRRLEQGPETKTVDIGDQVRKSRQPIRIATVKVNGKWYPSLLYSVADYVLLRANQPWPQESIAAKGANSPDEAVRQLAQAALDADVRRVIELLPPDEMGVLHDTGPVILKAMGTKPGPSGAKITKLETKTSSVGGRTQATRATLTALDVRTPDGDSFSVTKDGDCYRAIYRGESQQFCADQLTERVSANSSLPSSVKQVLRNLGNGVLHQGFGVITTEVDGKHYVSPIRSVIEQGMTMLRSLQPDDIKALLHMAN